MKKFFGFIGFLILLGIQSAYDTFVIWGLATWGEATSFVSDKITVILLATHILIVFNIFFLILVIISMVALSHEEKKEEEKGFKFPDSITNWFQKQDKKKEEEFKIPETIIKWIKDEYEKSQAK